MSTATEREAIGTLKKYRKILNAYLELTNENSFLIQVILRLREILSHRLHDLRSALPLDDADREKLGILQKHFDPYKRTLQQIEHEMNNARNYLDKHHQYAQARIDNIPGHLDHLYLDLALMEVEMPRLSQYISPHSSRRAQFDVEGYLMKFQQPVKNMAIRLKDVSYQTEQTLHEIHEIKHYISHLKGFLRQHTPSQQQEEFAVKFVEELDYFCRQFETEHVLCAQYSEGLRERYKALQALNLKAAEEKELEKALKLNLEDKRQQQLQAEEIRKQIQYSPSFSKAPVESPAGG